MRYKFRIMRTINYKFFKKKQNLSYKLCERYKLGIVKNFELRYKLRIKRNINLEL